MVQSTSSGYTNDYRGFGATNAAGSDSCIFGQAGSAYTSLGLSANDTFIYSPSGLSLSSGSLVARFTSGGIRFAIYGAGALTTDASGNITAASDERLKDIQGEFRRGLKDLRGITPILHKWKKSSGNETNGIYAGFSAQNVQKTIPEAVGTMNNAEKHLTLNDRPILAAVVNAINEIDRRLEKLEKLALAI